MDIMQEINKMQCPNCGKYGTVNCWRVLRLHCSAYRISGWIHSDPYDSVEDEDRLESNSKGLVILDCDKCKHKWGEPQYVPTLTSKPPLDYVI